MKENNLERIKWWEFTFILSIIGVFCFLTIFCHAPNPDEGNHLYSASLFWSGLKPYQDFFFDKLPLLLIVYGWPQKIFPPSLFLGRITATAFFLPTVFLIMLIGQKLGGRRTGILAGLLYGLKASNIIGGCMVYTYAPAIFFFCLSLYFFFVSSFSYRWILVVLFGSLATQARQMYLVALPFLLAVEYKQSGSRLDKLLGETFLVAVASCLYLIPIIYWGGENMLADTFYLYLDNIGGLSFWTSKQYWFKRSLTAYVPELLVGFLLLAQHFFYSRIKKQQRFWRYPETLFGAMIIMFLAISLRSHYSYVIHNLIISPLLVLLLSLSLNQLLAKFPGRAMLLVALIAFFFLNDIYLLSKDYMQIGDKFYLTTKILGQEIAQRTRPNDKILCFENYLLLTPKRQTVPNLTHSVCSILYNYDSEKCEKLNLVNLSLLLKVAANPDTKMVEFTRQTARYLEQTYGVKWFNRFIEIIETNYDLVFTYPDVFSPGGSYYLFQRRYIERSSLEKLYFPTLP